MTTTRFEREMLRKVRRHSEFCACRHVPGAFDAHEALLAHDDTCAVCSDAKGKGEMCDVGRPIYVRMVVAFASQGYRVRESGSSPPQKPDTPSDGEG